jgi:glycosyltransferase involved in cell wall biosynthesis
MRIAFVAPRVWPAVGGMESFLRHLSRSLASGHDVVVHAQGTDTEPRSQLADSLRPPPAFAAFDDGDVRVEPIAVPAARRALLAPLVTQVTPGLRRYAYGRPRIAAGALYARAVGPVLAAQLRGTDLVHIWGGDLLGAAAVGAARSLGVPVVATPFAHAGHWGDGVSFAATYRKLDRVVALLEADAALYESLGVARDRIAVQGVCSPGVDAGGGTEIRRRHSIAGPLVLFLGVRRPYKGFDLLLEAAAQVAGATFAFVGPGEPVRGANVIDAGLVDERERAGWLEAADLLCLPSDAEIFPVSALEAWSVRTPVLTSDIATLRELTRRSGGGIACPRDVRSIADAVRTLVAEPTRLRSLGAAGHDFWRRAHTVDAVASRHESLYRELLGEEAHACAA